MKTFYIDNHGCAKNQVDAEEILARLESSGWSWVDTASEADLIIVNTCGFIESAKKESIDAVMAMRAIYPEKRILLAGCLAQRYSNDLSQDMAEADGVFGNGDLSLVKEAAEDALLGKRTSLAPAPQSPASVRRSRLFSLPGSAYLKIAEGCSNHCSYCAIPLIRGEIRSRPLEEVVEDARFLLERGIHEINLIGQDLGSYGIDSLGRQLLPGLLGALRALEGTFVVRMLYIHPDHFPLAILDECEKSSGEDARILPYFDIPFQHASERILKAMGRCGNEKIYLDLIDTIRKRIPDAVLRSTFLLGFPGESDEDFTILRDFQDKASLEWLGAFEYSKEDGTPAAALKGRVLKKTVRERRQAVEDSQGSICARRLQRFIGRELDVLVEEPVREEALAIGRAWLNAPDVDGLVVLKGSGFSPGDLVRARIVKVNGIDLEGLPLAR